MIQPSVQNLLARASACIQGHDFTQADQCVSQVLKQDPKNIHGLCLRAIVALETGRKELALDAIKQALKLGPRVPGVLKNAANVFSRCGQQPRAAQMWERLIEVMPQSGEAHWNLAMHLNREGELDAAEKHLRAVLELAPDHPSVYVSLANLLKNRGQIEESIATYRESVRRHPGDVKAWSSLLYTLHFDPACGPEQIFNEHADWGQRFEAATPLVTRMDTERNAERRLRVGYVSPNFRNHVVGHNLMPLLRKHDRAQFEVVGYSDVEREDDLTKEMRGFTDQWRVTGKLSDAELAQQIAADRIDILVDLTMHMKDGRLGVFARKPAPVQVAFMAYPGSTGLRRMDFRFTDPILDPAGTDGFYTEQSVRLDSFWCFEPLAGSPEVGPLPAEKNGHITFGCLNNFAKINAGVLEMWREVLAAVPNARLMLLAPKGKTIAWLAEKLNVDKARLECPAKTTPLKYLALYNGVDLSLDPFPYTGHSTTLDGLWMGVPVVTLAGTTVASRGSASILTNLGLPELVATTKADYVTRAVRLANDLPRLRELRAGMRARLEKSVLMDSERFARKVETAYREMWRKWCEG